MPKPRTRGEQVNIYVSAELMRRIEAVQEGQDRIRINRVDPDGNVYVTYHDIPEHLPTLCRQAVVLFLEMAEQAKLATPPEPTPTT